ncbi:nitrate reductase [Pararhizobium sp. LjRoot235]|uniref:periplasmic nitrate reductase, NapE protein n=1 Tax=Pararhizobium sp. LjRoot235 TaxID=3342291 RepID=UPI003ECDBD45
MSESLEQRIGDTDPRLRRRTEALVFAVLAFGIWPLLAVGVVGGYGFIVWIFQIVFGLPGPPAH